MKVSDYLRLGWDQLRRRLVVTLLCTMGLAIGSSSIIVALSFGESINTMARQNLNEFLSSDEILVRKESDQNQSADPDPEAARASELTQGKIEILRTLPHVKALATYRTLENFSYEVDSKVGRIDSIFATELDTLDEFGIDLQQGGPSELENTIILSYGATMGLLDEQSARNGAVPGMYPRRMTQEEMEQWRSRMIIPYPVYQKQIVLKPQISRGGGTQEEAQETFTLRVIGILKKPQGQSEENISYQKSAYVSPALGKRIQEAMLRAQRSSSGDTQTAAVPEWDQVKIKVDDVAHVKELETLIPKLKLSAQSNLQREESLQQTLFIFRLIFGGAGVFILFVASISIVVAMTMSTHQRRRQIGIMKVLGANLPQIRNMFIVESALLGTIGGLAGILFSYWVVWTINIAIIQFTPPSQSTDEFLFISPWILPVGLVFAILTGILSGIYPAVNASRTDALTAIKRE